MPSGQYGKNSPAVGATSGVEVKLGKPACHAGEKPCILNGTVTKIKVPGNASTSLSTCTEKKEFTSPVKRTLRCGSPPTSIIPLQPETPEPGCDNGITLLRDDGAANVCNGMSENTINSATITANTRLTFVLLYNFDIFALL